MENMEALDDQETRSGSEVWRHAVLGDAEWLGGMDDVEACAFMRPAVAWRHGRI